MLLLLSVLLTGCWDRREINDVAFVVGTALDKEEDKYRTTLQITIPGQVAGPEGGGNGENPWFLRSVASDSLRGATLIMQTETPRKIFFSHRRSLLFGEALAREGISTILDSFGRLPENRLSALPVVTRGDAYQVLSAEPQIEQYPGEAIRELVFSYLKKPWTMKTLVNLILEEGIDPVMPLISTVESVPSSVAEPKKGLGIAGLAVFREDQLVGLINKEHAVGILLAMDQASNIELPVNAPKGKGKIFFSINENNAEFTPIVHSDEDITMKITIDARMSITTNESNYDTTEEANIKELEHEMNEMVKKMMETNIENLQNYKSDILGFGRLLKTEHPKLWARIKDRWDQIYPEITIEVEPKFRLENTGTATEPFAVKEGKMIK
nr:Ger(x)C family spore germination protein [Paenibacillus sp. Marseille-Q4541]